MVSLAEQVRTIAAAYAAFARGDLQKLLSLLADDIVWDATEALWERGLYVGRIGVQQYFRQLDEMWDSLRLADHEIIPVASGTFHVHGWLRGNVRGVEQDSPFTHHVELGPDGKIARLKIVVHDERRGS